nr:putative plasmid-related protein [Erwinia amylovora ATCC BAA-2158]
MTFPLFRRRPKRQDAHQYGDGPFAVNGHQPLTRDGRLTRTDEARLYATAPSVIDHVP